MIDYPVTTHFKESEWERSNIAARRGIDNSVPDALRTNLARTSVKMEEVRLILKYPVHISSGYRARLVNILVGGSPHSAHVKALACDFFCYELTPLKIMRILKDSGLMGFDVIILEFGWIHLGMPEIGAEPRELFLIAERNKKNGKIDYRIFT